MVSTGRLLAKIEDYLATKYPELDKAHKSASFFFYEGIKLSVPAALIKLIYFFIRFNQHYNQYFHQLVFIDVFGI